MDLKTYIEQLKKDAERLEDIDGFMFERVVNKAEVRLIRDIIEDLEKIEEGEK